MKKKLIYHIGQEAGFYSELNNMVIAILFCRRNNIDFSLYSKDANFGIGKGWLDFFKPFCNETCNPIYHFINYRQKPPHGGLRKKVYRIYKILHPYTSLTSDLWNSFHSIDYYNRLQLDAAQIASDIYVFNDKTQKRIDQLKSTLNLPEQYVGFHIRGGDKFIETRLHDVDEYINKTGIKHGGVAFVSTDDYKNVVMLRERYPSWCFYTLTEKKHSGYQQGMLSKISKEEKENEMINLFTSVDIMIHADRTYCTYSSNVGMFLGMMMGNRAIDIEDNKWRII